jgi:hypothetical protein
MRIVAGLGFCLALAGCAKPRVVTGVTHSRDQIKFLYFEGSEQGVIQCKINPGGALTDCHPMAVVVEE